MTSKKAIEILEECWRYEKTYKYTDAEIREALDLAIKALEFMIDVEKKCEESFIRSCEMRLFTDELSEHEKEVPSDNHYMQRFMRVD